ncbi:hypothetical protein, partial [Burkholderia sp. BE24]|uniref:hypothetical protein n=1 Tax=Burkholderia sp. BE24 TaxID=2656643 RepID=UPI001D102A0E
MSTKALLKSLIAHFTAGILHPGGEGFHRRTLEREARRLSSNLRRNHVDDLGGIGIDDYDVVAHEDEVVA